MSDPGTNAASVASAAWDRLRGARGMPKLPGLPSPPDERSPEELEADLADELSFHLHMLEREERDAGLEPELARTVARERFGDPEVIRAACRRVALRERLMLQRINTVLAVLLILAVIGLGVQGWFLFRTNARTLAAVDALRAAVEREQLAAQDARERGSRAAEAARLTAGDATPSLQDDGATAPSPKRTDGVKASSPPANARASYVNIRGPVHRPGNFGLSAGLYPLANVLTGAGGLALPDPYRTMEGIVATATIRRARGDGTDEVLSARWPLAGDAPAEPKVAALDRIEFGLEPNGAPPALTNDDVLAMDSAPLMAALDVVDFALRDATTSVETRTRLVADRERVANRMRAMGFQPKALAAADEPTATPERASGSPTGRDSAPAFDRTRSVWIDGDLRRAGSYPVQFKTAVSSAVRNSLPGPPDYLDGATVNVTVLRPRGDGTDETITDSWLHGKDPKTLHLVPADRVTVRLAYPSPLPPLDKQAVLGMSAYLLRETHTILAKAIASGEVDESTLARYRAELESIRLRLAAMGEKPDAMETPKPGAAEQNVPTTDSARATPVRQPGFAVILGDVVHPGAYNVPTGALPGNLIRAANGLAPLEGEPPKDAPTFEVVVLPMNGDLDRFRLQPTGGLQTPQKVQITQHRVLTEGAVMFVRRLTPEEANVPTPADAADALDRYLAGLTPATVATLRPVEMAAVRKGIDQALTRNPDEATLARLRELGATVDKAMKTGS